MYQQMRNRPRFRGARIDVNRFINKAVITEATEHFVPEHKFADFAIDTKLKHNITKKGYIEPTPIQDRVIPQVLRGADVVGIANTGTGKTAAFLLPLLHQTLTAPRNKTLIVVPTRELAIQIDEEFKIFAQGLSLFSVTCIGGTGIGRQISELRRRHNFVIGTPGRLKDLVKRRSISLPHFGTIVLDEADRMLDMGFINDMRFLMSGLPANRQTLFFSATLSPEINRLIGEFMRQPVNISVKTRDTANGVDQDVVRLAAGQNKNEVLAKLLNDKANFSKVLVFGRTKHGVQRLADSLRQAGIAAESIHGNKNLSQRQRALEQFKRGRVQVLAATDVAARGLDISDVTHVINYDLPATYDDYVHRIGRTGRAGKAGKALTFIEGGPGGGERSRAPRSQFRARRPHSNYRHRRRAFA